MSVRWTEQDISDLHGRFAVVTGANSGIGYWAAHGLAGAGATVVLATRNEAKGGEAGARICRELSSADVRVARLDLADLGSVRSFAESLGADRVDLLINNAGVMAAPRRLTVDRFESQLGTNHLGHFALTGLLLPKLLAASAPRVVTVSSDMHRIGRINFGNLQGERRYNNWLAYGQSKLANLMFCFELQRRATEAGSELRSVAAHPGYAATNLQFAGPAHLYEKALMAVGNTVFAQSARMGALPTLYAATAPDLPGGSFVGPDGIGGQRGYPHIVTAARKAYDEDGWRRLWDVSEQLTGVSYEFAAAAGAGAAGEAAEAAAAGAADAAGAE